MDSYELSEKLQAFPTPDIADALDELGYPDQAAIGLHGMWEDCPRIAGRVMPILLGPDKEGSTTIGTQKAMKEAEPGDILVFDNQGRVDINAFGSFVAFCANHVGIKGAIVDGVSRDINEIREKNFPLYARGVIPTSLVGRTNMAGYDISIECADVEVDPGDYVVADESGVIFVPGDEVERVLEIAPRFAEESRKLKKRVLEGADIVEVAEDYEPKRLEE